MVWLKEAPTEYLECRAMRHDWRHEGDYVHERKRNRLIAFKRIIACLRCGTRRIELWNVIQEERVSVYYDRYPDGYKYASDEGRYSVAAIAWEVIVRTSELLQKEGGKR